MILYLAEINENICEDILENRMSLLCLERFKKALQYKQNKDRIRSVYAGLLLQYGVKEWLAKEEKMLPRDESGRVLLRIAETEYGKPYLPDYPELFYNISHSGKYVGCAVASQPIGFDLQERRKCNHERMMQKFHPKERECYLQLDEQERELYFFQLWTAKEAYVKYIGKGLSERFSGFRVDLKQGYIYNSQGNPDAYCECFQLENGAYDCAVVSDVKQKIEIIIKNNL